MSKSNDAKFVLYFDLAGDGLLVSSNDEDEKCPKSHRRTAYHLCRRVLERVLEMQVPGVTHSCYWLANPYLDISAEGLRHR
jgi:hypothetical protein